MTLEPRVLPVHVRPYHLETPESFGRRLALANGLPERALPTGQRKPKPATSGEFGSKTLSVWCESSGGLAANHFRRQAERFGAGLVGRSLCRLCARGEEVKQICHAETNCCLRHSLWTGPGTGPEDQTPITETVRGAEVTYRKLRRAGRATISLLNELALIVNRHQGDARPGSTITAKNYCLVVALAQLVTDPATHYELFTPERTFAEARHLLDRKIGPLQLGTSTVLLDGLWRLLRPAFLVVRAYAEQGASAPTPAAAAVCSLINLVPARVLAGHRVQRPLEPPRRYLELLQTSLADRWQSACEVSFVAGQTDLPRSLSRQSVQTVLFLCLNGHWHERTLNKSYRSLKEGLGGCPYCAGLRPLAGYNSMEQTHPRLAAEWHPALNETLTPSEVKGAGNSASYWWKCPLGHGWQATPNNRSKGKNCPYCSGRRPLPGINTLEVTHPAIAAEWHYERNRTVKPSSITFGSGKKMHWICPEAHAYQATPSNRTRRGQGCPVCANRRVLPGVNDLATSHPEVAAEWHPWLNGKTESGSVVPGSSKKYIWLCPVGHKYSSSPHRRTANGLGCPFCAGTLLYVGYNDLLTTHPQLAASWDYVSNAHRVPKDFMASSRKLVSWVCRLGHSYSQRIHKRVLGSGCQYCANRKVLAGFNDLASRHPALAKEWHPQFNRPLEPGSVLPGNTKRWWKCPQGHEQFSTVPHRIKTLGCSKCPRDQRALSRPDD